jgi:PAS domain S-box-containing protein
VDAHRVRLKSCHWRVRLESRTATLDRIATDQVAPQRFPLGSTLEVSYTPFLFFFIAILAVLLCVAMTWALSLRRLLQERSRELEQSERKFQTIFRLSPIGIAISRASDAVITDANEAFAKLLRLSKPDIVGRTSLELNLYPTPETRQQLSQELYAKGELRDIVLTNRRPDGSPFVNITSASIVKIDGVDHIVAATVDITQLIEAKEELACSQRRFEAIFDLSPVGMIFSRLSDGMIIAVNRSYELMMGYGREELIGKTSVEAGLLDRDLRGKWAAELLKHRVLRDLEFEVFRKDGRKVTHSTCIEIIESDGDQFVLLTASDVTERNAARAELEESNRKFQALFELNPAAIVFAHAKSGTIVEVNRAFEELYSIPTGQAVGKTAVELGIYSDPRIREAFLKTLLRDGRVRGGEITRKNRDGLDTHLSGNAELLELNGDQYLLSAAIDVTAIKNAENQLKQINETLERQVAQRTDELLVANRELEAFCISVSHDLRSPLRAIQGFSQALEEDCGDRLGEIAKDSIGRIQSGVRRMSELIDDLLELSRVSRKELVRSTVDLSKMARTIFDGLQRVSPERRAHIQIEGDITVQGDSQLLKILLENLLGNAWKYTSKTEETSIEFGCERLAGQTEIFVRDNGAGFDARHLDKLFQPFQRLHSSSEFPGNGIGLATVSRIIRRHQGKIWAEGKVNEGAVFRFTLE